MEVIRLVRIDFDNMENRDCVTEQEVGIFAPDPLVGSAYAVVKKYFTEMAPVNLYTGHDQSVYPKWRIELRQTK